MKEFLLIRHGETAHNKEMRFTGITDVGLNDSGRAQAAALKEKFLAEEIPALYSSDLKRCFETASIISGGAEIVTTPRLREMNFGVFEGLTYREIREMHDAEYLRWKSDRLNHGIMDGESFKEMADRVLSWFDEMMQGAGDKTAIVSHSGCIRTILSYYLLGGIDDTWRFAVDNCTINRLCFDDGYAYLKTLNEK